jgi:UDP-glucose 4-epimerase
VTKSLDFAAHLLRKGRGRLIFSSSANSYQASEDLTVDEDSPIAPQSPYGRTKAVSADGLLTGPWVSNASRTTTRLLAWAMNLTVTVRRCR